MLKSLFDNVADVLVGKAVIYVLSRLAIGDKIALPENLQLMRYGRFSHAEKISNIAHAHRLALNGEKYADPCGIAEYLKEVRQIVQGVFGRHRFPLLFNNIAVQLLAFAGRRTLFVKLHFLYLFQLTVERLFNC